MESQPPCYFLNQINNRFFRKAFLPITERFFESLTPRFLLHLKSCGCLLQSVSSTVLHYLGSLFGTVRVFSCWSESMRSSIVPSEIIRHTSTTFFCPIRCARPAACSSMAGFHQRSYKMTVSAPVRFNPVPPAFKEIRKTSFRQH